jgi:hypothetical protein
VPTRKTLLSKELRATDKLTTGTHGSYTSLISLARTSEKKKKMDINACISGCGKIMGTFSSQYQKKRT